MKNKELRLALISIIAYVVLLSLAENLSAMIGIKGIINAPITVLFDIVLCVILFKTKKFGYYGFTSLKTLNHAKLWFYIPFIIIAGVNLWCGAVMRYRPLEMVLVSVSMLSVGFIEEVIFRGFLFKAMCKDNVKTAVIVSSVTFGLGHIVNLLNGAELTSTLMQLVYAVAVGLAFTLFVLRTGNIIPCIICHSVLDFLTVFANEAAATDEISVVISIILTVVSLIYAYKLYKLPQKPSVT